MCGISICRESYAHAFIVRSCVSGLRGVGCVSGPTQNPTGSFEYNKWLREWTTGCDCVSGSTLTLCGFIGYD